jgi:preprotein translocase subunit SecA
MQRLKIDDSVPVAAGIVNKTIEQAQTRVEGANFDIRKHLIEYDDVLNSQRNAIYTQRDRVFTKDDLTEDFDEMLTAEVQRRVELNAAEADRWKLFAWLDDTQPPIVLSEDELHPTYTQEILLRDLEAEGDKAAAPSTAEHSSALRAGLLALARDSLKTEREHLLEAVESQIDRAEERLDDQIKEKRRLAEDVLEGLENEAEETNRPVDARAAYRAVGEALGINLSATSQDLRDFDVNAFKRRLEELAEASVSARTRAALVAAIERRLGASLGLGRESKNEAEALDFDSVRRQLTEAAEKTFDAKTQRVLADIEREAKSYFGETPTRAQLARALWQMQFGRAVAFDQKTHKRTEVAFQRLHYVFLAAKMTKDWTPKELQEEILAHLRAATEALLRLFGQAEHRARVLGGVTPTDAPEELGRRASTGILRQLMLQTIGGLWVEYLTSVEALRTSIGLEAYAQRDPLVAYKSKATEMWNELLANIRAGVVSRAMTLRPRFEIPQPQAAPARAAQAQPVRAANGGPAPTEAAPEGEPETVAAESQGGGKRKRRRR